MTSENDDLVESGGKVRLFVTQSLAENALVALSANQSHYLVHVMRAKVGARLRVFNGHEGEWRARIAEVGRKSSTVQCEAQIAEQSRTPDFWLAFAPIKKMPIDYLAQKATELGVRVLLPVLTRRTIVRRVNTERMRANAVEAAEQSGRLDVPVVKEPVSLDALIASWLPERTLVFCDEAGEAPPITHALATAINTRSWGVLIGPEGGFDTHERALVRAQAFVLPVTLGPRIMRADTAAIAALAILASIRGDWAAC